MWITNLVVRLKSYNTEEKNHCPPSEVWTIQGSCSVYEYSKLPVHGLLLREHLFPNFDLKL